MQHLAWLSGFLAMASRRRRGFQPTQLAGLGLWLDAADTDTITDSVDFVSQWDDKSTNGRDATQFTMTNQPLTNTLTMNGLNVITFDGSNDFFDFDGTFLAGTDYTIFFVEQRSSSKSNNLFTGVTGGPPIANTILILGYTSNIAITHEQFSNGYEIPVPAFTVKIPRIHTFTQNSVSGKKYYQDGGQQGSDANTDPMISYLNATIGGFAGIAFYEGDIAEIIIYPRTLPDSERGQIDVYLSDKWGITLTFPFVFSDDFSEDFS